MAHPHSWNGELYSIWSHKGQACHAAIRPAISKQSMCCLPASHHSEAYQCFTIICLCPSILLNPKMSIGKLPTALRREFGEQGPFWGRQYIFWHDSKPLTLIYEVFSPRLQRLLGPSLLL